jgi:hypothetical protein
MVPTPALPATEGVAQAQEDAQSRATTPGSVGTVAGVPGGSGDESYLIVDETNAPHSTLATAQGLPDVPYFGVIGTLGPDDAIDLFRMPLDPGMLGVQFELVAQQRPVTIPVQFSLFDGTGRLLGRWSSGDDPGASVISLELASPSIGTTLFLGISATSPNGPSGSSPTTDYQLWVTRLTATDPQPAGTGAATTPLLSTPSPLTLGPIQPLAPLAASPQAQAMVGAQAAPAPVSNGPGAGIAPAVGSLPTRTAGPLAGVLAVSNPNQAVLRPLIVTVHLEGKDRPTQTPGLDTGEATGDGAEPAPGDAQEALVALRGPGGFPLLGAAAIGHRRRTLPAVAAASAEPTAHVAIDPPAMDPLAAQDPGPPTAEPVPTAVASASGPRTWGEAPITLSFGLSMATVLTLNVVLSDPVAGFDYLASRLDNSSEELTTKDTKRGAKKREE